MYDRVRAKQVSDGQDAVLAPWAFDAFVGAHSKAARDRGTRFRGVDHVVELTMTGCDVRIDVRSYLLCELEPFLRSLLLVLDGVELPPVNDVHGTVGAHDRDLGRRPGDDV